MKFPSRGWQSIQFRHDSHRSGLCDNSFDDFPVIVGKSEIATVVAIGEFLMIETEQVENRCVQIVNVNFILHGSSTELIGRATISMPMDGLFVIARAQNKPTVFERPTEEAR